MISPKGEAVTVISCGIFAGELEELRRLHWPSLHVKYLDSMLHMRPSELDRQLVPVVEEELNKGNAVLLLYGDCCPKMTATAQRVGVTRTPGANCASIFLGEDEYKRIMHEGVFVLLPEWARRWHQVFSEELGLNCENAKDLMRDMHLKLVYLNTGVAAEPRQDLDECAAYCGLPIETRAVRMDRLKGSIDDALALLKKREGTK
jgi:hypothetical protein